MKKLYCKWVSEGMKTINETHWEVGVPNELPENNDLKLCFPGLFHYFTHPLLALMFKNSNGCYEYTKLYEAKPEGKVIKNRILCGATKVTLGKELKVPQITDTQRIAFAILCVLVGYKEPKYVDWAEKWLSGEDRSKESAITALDVVCDNPPFVFVAADIAALVVNGNDDHIWISSHILPSACYALSFNQRSDLISLAQQAMKVK